MLLLEVWALANVCGAKSVSQCVPGFCPNTYRFVPACTYRVQEEKLAGGEKLSLKVVQTNSFRIWAYICFFFPTLSTEKVPLLSLCRYTLTRTADAHTHLFWPSGILVA